MALRVLDQAVIAAIRADGSQTGKRDALIAPFGSGDVTVLYKRVDGTTIQIDTHGPMVPNSLTPRGFTLGPLLADTVVISAQLIDHAVYRTAGGSDIYRRDAADLALVSPTTLTGRRINASDLVLTKQLVTTDPALPVTSTTVRSMTWSAADTGTVAVGASGSITNTGNVSQAWSITPPANVTVSPSSGTLAAGATQALTITASQAGSYTLTLVAAGATITGNNQTFVASAGVTVATAGTLSVTSPGVNGSTSPVSVTLNGIAPPGGVIFTLAATNGATLGSSTLSWSGGESGAAKSTTISLAATGSSVVTMTNSAGLTNTGSSATYTSADPVSAGTWQTLTFPAIMRRQVGSPGTGGGSSSAPYNPAVALANEAITPISTANVPHRAFCRATMGEPGVLYYHGSLHSDYAGNELDRIDLRDLAATQVGLSINHQPNVPAWGPASGYGSGSGAYLYRQYDTGLADNTLWQPTTYHNWCYNGYHPAHGYLLYSGYAVNDGATLGADPGGNGSGYVQSSKLYYSGSDAWRQNGFVRYYKNAKYELAFNGPNTTAEPFDGGVSGVAGYNSYRQSLFVFLCNYYTLRVYELIGTTMTLHDNQSVAAFSTGITGGVWPESKNGNGLLALPLDADKFLLFTTNYHTWGAVATTLDRFNFSQQIYVYDAQAKTMTRVLMPSNITGALAAYISSDGDGMGSFAVDRAERKVYYVSVDGASVDSMRTGPLLVWVASFDDLTTWQPLSTTGSPTVALNFAIDREPAKVYNGHLFVLTRVGSSPGSAAIHRVKLTQGETPPAFTFTRHDYATQNFTLAPPISGGSVLNAKHANHAYRPADGLYYQFGGDIINSFTQATYTLSVSTSAYTFAQKLTELTPAPVGYIRPASPDDGAWCYAGATNPNSALADKFIFARGGDGTGVRGNANMESAYADDAAAFADRWSTAKLVIYDPVNNRFSDAGSDTWTVTQGALGLGHPSTWPSQAMRGGVFDKSTNTFFRFGNNGPLVLTAFKFDTQQIRIWATSGTMTLDGQTVYLDGDQMIAGCVRDPAGKWWTDNYNTPPRKHVFMDFSWEHENCWIDERDGKLYVVSPASGMLWCFETRGTETTDGSGLLRIPYYPVGERVPLDAAHMLSNNFGGWSVRLGSYLVPFKGGLLYTCDTPGGSSGLARYAYWRRLGYTGAWTPITLPQDWAANSFGRKSTSIDNDELLGIGGFPMARSNSSVPPAFYLVT